MKKVLKFLLSQYSQYRWQSGVMFFLMIFTLAYQVTFSYSFKYLMDDILVSGEFNKLTPFLYFLVSGAVLSSLADLVTDYILLKTGLQVQDELRYRVFRHLQMLPESYYNRQSSSSVVSRLSGDLNTIHAAFLTLQAAVNAVLGLLFSLIILYVINTWFFVLMVIGLPACFILPKLLNQRVTDASDLYKTREDFNGLIMDRLIFHQLIRSYGLQSWEFKRLAT